MPECTSCGDATATVQWREARWCVDCFEDDAGERGAEDDWIRRVLGRTANPTFEPPVEALDIGLESRIDLLSEQTVLDEDLAEMRALQERGLTAEEIADSLGVALSEIEERDERIERRIELARNTIQFLEE